MLSSGEAPPDLADVSAQLAQRGSALGRPIHWMRQTGSTSDDAKRAARLGAPHGAVFIAESQTQGRGRQGRSWTSPIGDNLLFSVLLRIPCGPATVPLLSLAAGLSVRDAVATCLPEPERVLVKWPNDVVVRGEGNRLLKLAGILVESALLGSRVEYVVIGVGVNVLCRTFPEEIAAFATSVALQRKEVPERGALLVDLLLALERDIQAVVGGGLEAIHSRLSGHDALLGRRVTGEDGTLVGIARGIERNGHLCVERDDGSRASIAWGEVRLSS